MSYYQMGEIAQAKEWFYKASEGRIRQKKIWRNIAMVESESGDLPATIKAYERVLALKPTIDNLYTDMLAEAIDEAGYEDQQDTLRAMLANGVSDVNFGRYYQPIVDWSMKNDQTLSDDYGQLGQVYHQIGDFDNAFYYTEQSLEIGESDLMTMKRKGVILIKMGRIQEAKTTFQQVLSSYPGDQGAVKAMDMLNTQFQDTQQHTGN
jgi:tetratricopeptide (TPR) repeat protein